jgi:type IV secretion system protein VirB9
MRTLILTACACAVAGPALALEEPAPGKLDPRMVTAAYNPAQVYAVHVPQGQTLAVTLAPDEIATDGFGADGKSLRADLSGNTVLLWSGEAPVTPRSMFIRSRTPDGKARTYALLVDTRPPDQAAVGFTFTYPMDEAAKQATQWRIAQADREQKAAKAALDAASGASDSNLRYVLQGKEPADWDLLPTREVSDNGTDTHFHFPGAMRVPIIYAVNPDGKEAVVEPTFNSQTGVATVHQLARAFHLRDGDALLCVFNKAFDPVGIRSETGTISPSVERETKGAAE